MTQALILNFHGLGPIPGHVSPEEVPYWIDTDTFRDYLTRIRELASIRPVHITFDDGNRSDLGIALPLLQEYGLKADFFVCAGRIGQPAYLDRGDIAELIACGMGVGSHGMDHVNWHQASASELHREIVEAWRYLEDICRQPVRDFAIPFGAYDRRVLALIRKSGGACAYTSDGGMAEITRFLRPRNTLVAGPAIDLADLVWGPLPQITRRAKIFAKSLRGGPA